MGVQPVSEASAHGCGGLAMDLCCKFGLIVQDFEGNWILSDDFLLKRAYIFGNVKTWHNTDKIVNNIMNRLASTAISETEAIVFDKALAKLVVVPGDWHAGLTMLQSIFSIFGMGFLDLIRQALGWTCINQDTRNYYYQGSWLTMFVQEQLNACLIHGSVSEKSVILRCKFLATEKNLSDANYVCFVSSAFQTHLDSLHNSDDNWQRTCAMFICMANDFFTFVAWYSSGESIGIEIGYQNFVGVWKALGQTRYLECH